MLHEDMDEVQQAMRSMVAMVPGDFEADTIIEDEVTEANVDDDDPSVIWKMPDMPKDEVLDVLASLGQLGTMNAADLE